MRRRIPIAAFLLASSSILAGCVNSDFERAGIGAAAGGLTAAALGGNVATGAAVGAAGGALCDDVDLC